MPQAAVVLEDSSDHAVGCPHQRIVETPVARALPVSVEAFEHARRPVERERRVTAPASGRILPLGQPRGREEPRLARWYRSRSAMASMPPFRGALAVRFPARGCRAPPDNR
jgi:hypothetical protein